MFSKVDKEISKSLANLIQRHSDSHTSLIKDLTERNSLEKQVFDSKKALFNQVKSSGLYGMQVEMQDENGFMQPIMNADELSKIQDALVRADPSDDRNLAVIDLNRRSHTILF